MKLNDKKSLVSVVMPVYNAENYLEEAVESILNQSYDNFELLIINDGSVDNSKSIAESLCKKDNRLIYLENKDNKGVAFTRNVGLRNSNGNFICWMDSDDTCDTQRLEKQVDFLSRNPEIGAVGTQIERFNQNGSFEQTSLNSNPEYIKASLLFRPAAVPNATIMLRNELIKKYNLSYNEQLRIGEDYGFVTQCSHHFRISILPEILYSYRIAENSITEFFNSKSKETFEHVKRVYKFQLNKIGLEVSEDELLTHDAVCNSEMITRYGIYKQGVDLMSRIENANKTSNIYDKEQLKQVLKTQYVFFGKKAGPIGLRALIFYTKLGFKLGYGNGFKNWLKIAVRCLLKYEGFEFEWPRALGFKT
ncbi:glycosyltransferase family 2 protein [Croceivirga thetidis]|uniref:Glycosyltransferase family 2 protein n=1 Tax=Croceivirga thetidis TaxID=2721623 RepID=A0ABX1GQZ5_9FLAO|nr:glycosyltransferase family 2 protein [Croceivirga thetidis]NKI32043.1 glycosyltransferase family 2 protein [Croceivirga thetidis]